MYEDTLNRLKKSDFRNRFKLREAEKVYIRQKGMDTIKRHTQDFIARRIAPDNLPNDGRQTPMKGHPVFIAQHATACCCRQCIKKWHGFSDKGVLSATQQEYLCGLILEWIEKQLD